MAELPPIKKPPKQSSKGLGFLFGATIEGGGLISSLVWGGVMGVLIYFTVRFLRGN